MSQSLGYIKWARGDNYPFAIIIKVGGTVADLTDFESVTLCLDAKRHPVGTATQLFYLEGEFDEDRTTGRVTFTFTEEQADNLGKYYYGLRSVDGEGHRRSYSIEKNVFEFVQTINRG